MEFVSEFPACLRSGETTFLTRIDRLYAKLLDVWLRAALEHAPRQVRDLFTRISDLAPERVGLLLTAPETFNRLYGFVSSRSGEAHRALVRFLSDALTAEHYLATGTQLDVAKVGVQELWTAPGDYQVFPDRGSVKPNGHRCSGILIDGASAGSSFYHDLAGAGLACFTRQELDDVYAKVAAAIDAINRRTPSFGRLLESSIRTISVEKYGSRGKFNSGSRSTFIGKVGLVNPHSATEAEVCDALIHEATHSLLYTIELFEPLFTRRAAPPTIKSPWTGKSLSLHAYTHACFVWYVLTLFWIAYDSGPAGGGEYLARAGHGFLAHDLSAPIRGYVADSVALTIQDMQQRVKVVLLDTHGYD
jgi:hypothetical protein